MTTNWMRVRDEGYVPLKDGSPSSVRRYTVEDGFVHHVVYINGMHGEGLTPTCTCILPPLAPDPDWVCPHIEAVIAYRRREEVGPPPGEP